MSEEQEQEQPSNDTIHSQDPPSRTSTPPLYSAPKKFAAVNATKKFLSKSGTAGVIKPTSSQATPVPIASSSRLLSTKLTSLPSSRLSPSPKPPPPPTVSPWAKPTPPEPPKPVPMGTGMIKTAWRPVADNKRGGLSRDFPTANEVAEVKKAAAMVAQAHAAHNQAILQDLNAFTHIEASHRWDEEDDDDLEPPPPPVTKAERFVEDFDRSWSKTSERVLFNATSNRLEAPPSRPDAPKRILKVEPRPEVPQGPPPQQYHRQPERDHQPPIQQQYQRQPDHDHQLALHHRPERDHQPLGQPHPQYQSHQPPQFQQPPRAPQPPTNPWQRPPQPQNMPPGLHQSQQLQQSPQTTSRPQPPQPQYQPQPQIQPPIPAPAPVSFDSQAAEMHTAAEKARLRRLAEEAEREAAAERARRKAKELEERLGLKPHAPVQAPPAPIQPTPVIAPPAPTILRRPKSPEKESPFNGMLAKIQAAMVEARTTEEKPVGYFDVSQPEIPKTPPPAWRTFRVQIPRHDSRKVLGDSSPPIPPCPPGWLFSHSPPLQINLADLLPPAQIRISSGQFIPYERKKKRRYEHPKQTDLPPPISDSLLPESHFDTQPKPAVRFMVSSELEGDSLLDEVNKMSLEAVSEEPPKTPPRQETSPNPPWSAPDQHIKSVWQSPVTASPANPVWNGGFYNKPAGAYNYSYYGADNPGAIGPRRRW